MIHHRQTHAQEIIRQATETSSIDTIKPDALADALQQLQTSLPASQVENLMITLTAVALHQATLRKDLSQVTILKERLLKQLNERQNSEPLNLRGACLEKMTFKSESTVNLMRADLSGANLDYSVFNYCSFEEANLKGASVHLATFLDCNLNDANLNSVDLSGACFSRCTFDKTTLVDAILKGKYDGTLCNFEEVDMSTAQWLAPSACTDVASMKKSLDALSKQVAVKNTHPYFHEVKEKLSCAVAKNIHACGKPEAVKKMMHHTLFKPTSVFKHGMNKVASWLKAEEKLPYPTSSQTILKK